MRVALLGLLVVSALFTVVEGGRRRRQELKQNRVNTTAHKRWCCAGSKKCHASVTATSKRARSCFHSCIQCFQACSAVVPNTERDMEKRICLGLS
uniref:Pancreatic trypsin inhibitor n=1 Tax=Rhipicephalus appendiculatus TaxID=34631 RepID=A0A131YGC2_RHIAP